MQDPSGESGVFFMEPTDSDRLTAIEPYCLESPISAPTCLIFSAAFWSELNIDLIPLRVLDKEDDEEFLTIGGFLVVGGGGGNAGFLLTTGPSDLFSIWLWNTFRKEAVVPLRGLVADFSDLGTNWINNKNACKLKISFTNVKKIQ